MYMWVETSRKKPFFFLLAPPAGLYLITIEWNGTKFSTNIHGPQMRNPNNCGDLLTLLLAPRAV